MYKKRAKQFLCLLLSICLAATCLVFPAAADCEHDFVDNICKHCQRSYCDINGHDYINNDDQESCTVCGVKRCANGDHVYDSGGECLYCTNYNESYDVLPRYTVTFMDGTTTLSTSTVKIGNCVEKPADPEKTNFTFTGWFEEGETTAFDFDTPISADTTLYAHFAAAPVYSYIGADGSEVETTNYTLVTSSETNVEWSGTMIASGNVTINGNVKLTGDTNLILCDDAKLTVDYFIDSYVDSDYKYSMNIFGQTEQSGKLTSRGIFGKDISIYGGDITAVSVGIYAVNACNIVRGKVHAHGYGTDGCGIESGNSITISGGEVTVWGEKQAICSEKGTVTLGWTEPGDKIVLDASWVGANRIVFDNAFIIDENGTLATEDNIIWGNETLTPAYAVTFMDGETTLSAVGVAATGEATVTKPADPEKTGFTFTGWYLENAETAFDFTTAITADTTLYAHFTQSQPAGNFAALQTLINDTADNGTLVLDRDYTALSTEGYIEILSDKTITIDLNGHTIDRGLTQAVADGYVIFVEGYLTLTDSSDDPDTEVYDGIGKITGGNNILDSDIGKSGGSGGGVHVYGGTFTMNGGTIRGNTSQYSGGGVYVDGGTFTMNGGEIRRNTSQYGGGGVAVKDSIFTMNGGTIIRNTASAGGGVEIGYNCTITMNGGEISYNTASGLGGGMIIHGNTFAMTGGEISYNTASSDGGGVFVYEEGAFIMTGGTLSGNTALGGDGVAALGVFYIGNNAFIDDEIVGNAEIVNTITISETTGGTVSVSGKTLTIGDEIYCAEGEEVTLTAAPDEGYALSHFIVNGEAIEGNTFTMPDSDVTVSAVFCTAGSFTHLQAQIDGTENNATLVLDRDYTALSNEGYITIPEDNTITIDLNGHTIDRGLTEAVEDGYVIKIIGNLTLTDRSDNSATDEYDGTGKITGGNNTDGGGGVHVSGTFTMTGGTISGNSAGYGGGVNVVKNGTFTMNGGTISGNTAKYEGGGVRVDVGGGTFTMTGGEIRSCSASGGGGVDVSGTFTMTGGTISDNTAELGGDVYVGEDGKFYLKNGVAAPAGVEGTITRFGTVTINNTTGGTITASEGTLTVLDDTFYIEGATVTLTVTPASFSPVVKDSAGNNVEVTGENGTFTFKMPDKDVTVEPKKFTVAVTPVDTSGNAVAVQGSWLDSYLSGTSVTLTAPAAEGYNFVGWYAGETKLCGTNAYTFTITENVDLIAKYEALGKVSLTIDGGSSFTINGDAKSTSITADYTLGTTITAATNTAKFAYWKNSYGMVLSRSASYTFTVTGADTITAVFDTVVENKATLVFESAYGQVMAREQLATGGSMEIPSLPYRNGYTALGWDMNGDGEYNADDTLTAAITRGLAATNNMVVIRPVYELKTATYTIEVVNGTGSGTYNQNDKVTVTANAAPDGQKFSRWEISGQIVSYNTTYQFFAYKNLTITAVFVDNAEVVDAKGTTEIIDKFPDKVNHKLIFISMSAIPSGYVIEKAGVIATNDSTIGTDATKFTDTANNVRVRGNSWTGTSYKYTWTMPNVGDGETWYVRAYLIYKDANGNSHTIYGDIVSQTMSFA